MDDIAEAYWQGALDKVDAVSPRHNTSCLLHKYTDDLAFLFTFANVSVIDTPDGLVLIDCGYHLFGSLIKKRIRSAFPGKRVHTCIYTHGHVDHCMGILAFEECAKVQVIGHKAVATRFDRYKITNGYNAFINSKQFNAPPAFPTQFRYPDVTYEHSLDIEVGGIKLELHHHRGETDDATWVWVPKHKCICTGDFMIWATPNCGNPQKVQRYPQEWAVALREMLKLNAELLLPGHGAPVVGKERVRLVLEDTAVFLEDICAQTLRAINQGMRLADIVKTIQVPQQLISKPYLRPVYDDPRFIVHNIWRQYAGWWDQDPAHLRVGHEDEVAQQVANLAGGALSLAYRASDLAHDGKLDTAVQLIEWSARVDPTSRTIHKARAAIYRAKSSQETSLMAKSIFLAAQMDSERILNSPAWRFRQIEYNIIEELSNAGIVIEIATILTIARTFVRPFYQAAISVLHFLGVFTLLSFILEAFPFEIKMRERKRRDHTTKDRWTSFITHKNSFPRLAGSSLVWPPHHRHAKSAEHLVTRFKALADEPKSTWVPYELAGVQGVSTHSKHTQLVRYKTVIEDTNVFEILNALVIPSCRAEWDKSLSGHRVWQTLDPSTRLCHAFSSAQSFLPDHDFALLVVTEITKSGTIIVMMASVQDLLIPETPGMKRGQLELSGWVLKPLQDNRVRVIQYLESKTNEDMTPKHVVDTQTKLAQFIQAKVIPPIFTSIGGFLINTPEWRPSTQEFQVVLACDNTMGKTTSMLLDPRCYKTGCNVTITPARAVRAVVDHNAVVIAHDDPKYNGTFISIYVAPKATGHAGEISLLAGSVTTNLSEQLKPAAGLADSSSDELSANLGFHDNHNGDHTHDTHDNHDHYHHLHQHRLHPEANDMMCEQPQ